jgi:putative hydroxymethylpyrimidine transport system substrate-binding protein
VRLTRLVATSLVTAAFLAGCGGDGDATETETANTPPPETPGLQVNFQGKVGPPDAGFLLAHKLGYFPQNKLHVWFVTPSHPARTPMYIEQELEDAAIAYGPQLILAREQGKPLVAFGSVIPHPTMAMIWLKGSGIDSIADLKGKTIAFPGVRFQKFFLEAVLEHAGLKPSDVKFYGASYYLESELIQGRADAIFGGSSYTEGQLLKAHGLEPVVTPVRKLGIPDYDELIFIARRDRYAKEAETYQRLLEATVRGGAEVANKPGAATKAIIAHRKYENSSRPNFPLHPKPTQAGVEEIAPLFSHSGEIDRAKLKRLVDWMYEEGMIKRRWRVSQLIASP